MGKKTKPYILKDNDELVMTGKQIREFKKIIQLETIKGIYNGDLVII